VVSIAVASAPAATTFVAASLESES
jgi:hypothetical protein